MPLSFRVNTKSLSNENRISMECRLTIYEVVVWCFTLHQILSINNNEIGFKFPTTHFCYRSLTHFILKKQIKNVFVWDEFNDCRYA